MTEQKAIELLRFAYPKEITKPITEEVISMAVASLEKQIPKKPKTAIVDSWGFRSNIKVCPECDCCLSMIYLAETKEEESIKTLYCGRCGQKIDLEEVEE